MSRLTRRRFLQSSLAAAATVTIAGTKSSGKVLGANDTIRLAVAGLNGRGGDHVAEFLKLKDVEIVCLIDPDTRTYGKRFKQIAAKGGRAPKTVQDVRQALEDKDLHAVSVATPNHWHSLITIWACQAGKDVYVEKPCSHNLHEGAVAVQAARKYGRIVQHGTQSRSSARWGATAELVRSGQFGKLLVSRALCYKPRKSIGFKLVAAPPKELDFNIWLGPAQERPFHENLVHYNWHWFWDFGNGDIGNQGVHEMDIARWMIPGATLPRSVLSLGGRFGYSDQGETPNTQITLMDFGPTQLIFEVRGLETDALRGQKIGNILHFESGVVAGGKFYPRGGKEAQPLPKVEVKGGPPRRGNHFANFLAAMRSRKVEDLCADIEEGATSAALCHLANVSYRLGELVPFNPRTKAFGDNKDAYEALARMEEHLAQGNGLKLDGLKYRLGRRLPVGERGESLASDPQVRPLLSRNYRKSFEVPAKV